MSRKDCEKMYGLGKKDCEKMYGLGKKDCEKIDPTGTAARMFHQIPAALNGNANRYIARNSTEGKRMAAMQTIISSMKESMTVNIAYHANCPSAGMALHQDLDKFKMYVADTGLFVTLAFWDNDFTGNSIYQKLLNDKLEANLGYVYENIIAQTLTTAGHKLYYYTFPTNSGKHNYEVDFLISDGDKVSPIEVESSGYKRHTSLDVFCKKFSQAIENRYLIYTKDIRKEEQVLHMPVYYTQFL